MAVRSYNKNQNIPQRTFLYDPLGGGPTYQPYDGEWITFNALFNRYAWKNRRGNIYAGIVENEGDIRMNRVFLHPTRPTDKAVRIEVGTVVRRDPRITSEEVRRIWSAGSWHPLVGAARHGWRLIAWNLEASESNIGYVHLNDIIETKSITLPPSTPVDVDNDMLRNAIQALKDDKATLKNNNKALQEMLHQYETIVPRVRTDLATLP
jgi:hypothetical protein